uniref:Uncharacterized protein n=1 Tax=Anguilla anguilla TaxID=7936 RepID=A0A0E9Y2N3_ANGAN
MEFGLRKPSELAPFHSERK